MHETFIAQQVVNELLRAAEPYSPKRITRVALKAGVLKQVVPELLRFALDVATRDTVAEGAQWDIELAQCHCRCGQCGHQFIVQDWVYLCPACGSGHLTGLSGDEIVIESVTMEQEDEPTEPGPPQGDR